MLHHIGLVPFLYGPVNNVAFDVTSIYEIIFEASIALGNKRLPDITGNFNLSCFGMNLQKIPGNVPSVKGINDFLCLAVSGGIHQGFATGNKPKADVRTGKGHSGNQIMNVGALRQVGF